MDRERNVDALTHAEAKALLEIWDRLSRQHVALATGCACGIGGVTLQLQDFEQDIADFVLGQAERGGRADVVDFLQRRGRDGRQWSVGGLLAALGSDEDDAPVDAGVAGFILARLGRTLRSFAKLHG